jgi:hypothetical protein
MKLAVQIQGAFRRIVLRRASTAFVVLGLAFLGFGVGALNLATLLKANLDLVIEHGWQALMDGAAMQLVELLASAYLSMACYIVFKACEHRLVHGLTSTH